MNELRSTEILDKEIQEDARRKSEKIIEAAKAECVKIENSVAERLEKSKNERISKYDEKISAFKKDKESSIPLEKQRFHVSFIQDSINSAFDEYIKSLSENEQIELVLNPLKEFEKSLKSKKVNAYVYGFELENAKNALAKKVELSSCSKTEFNKLVVESDFSLSCKKGIILETVDKSVRCRLTFSELISQVEDKYRMELCTALFGSAFASNLEANK